MWVCQSNCQLNKFHQRLPGHSICHRITGVRGWPRHFTVCGLARRASELRVRRARPRGLSDEHIISDANKDKKERQGRGRRHYHELEFAPVAQKNGAGRGASQSAASLCSRSASFAKKLNEAPLGDIATLSEIIHSNRNRHNITYTKDGYVLASPTTIQEKAAAVEFILQTMDDARVKGAGCEAGPLDEQQKRDAYAWLKDQWLQKWNDNQQLQQEFLEMKAGVVPTRAQKKSITARKNSAFNAFLYKFVGNLHVARIMMNNGFTTTAEFQGLLRELHVHYDSPEHKKEKQDQLDRASKNADVKAAAHKARRQYKDAARIDRKVCKGEWKYNSLTPTQARMMDCLVPLRQSMLTANEAYGFGLGSRGQRTAIATAVAVEYASRDLRHYFA